MPDRADLEDLFRPFGAVTVKRMFGGHGIYADGLMFALEAGGEIFLKTDSESLPQFAARGLKAFVFDSRRGEMTTSYRLMPEEAHDDEHELRRWAALALTTARRVAAEKKAKKKPANNAPSAPRKRA
ncbi:TfoX/Sxy family protein [Roseiarcaceae bacterium H3SJ34-1]|uniref:TfoX/Sxy family protein n=1 Tax=Terripilifer ovatus TaxID=3032367 RepID=UPI003AB96DC5|nr:TfoX/Sxy family protein [Roseiarcaceae bacterium H3SJ34-1]